MASFFLVVSSTVQANIKFPILLSEGQGFLNICGENTEQIPTVCFFDGDFIPLNSTVLNINVTRQLLNAG